VRVLTILRRTISLWWRTWPWLAAIYLIGWFLRYWALHLAIHVALGHGDFWGSLVLPLTGHVKHLGVFDLASGAVVGHPGDRTGQRERHGFFRVVLDRDRQYEIVALRGFVVPEPFLVGQPDPMVGERNRVRGNTYRSGGVGLAERDGRDVVRGLQSAERRSDDEDEG
jgi:hypothetical protein